MKTRLIILYFLDEKHKDSKELDMEITQQGKIILFKKYIVSIYLY